MRILTRLAGTALLVLGGETVGINDSRATLALPDIAAKRKRLAERQRLELAAASGTSRSRCAEGPSVRTSTEPSGACSTSRIRRPT